jgi:hypothetical protein
VDSSCTLFGKEENLFHLPGVEQRMVTVASCIRKCIVFSDWMRIPILYVLIKSWGLTCRLSETNWNVDQ